MTASADPTDPGNNAASEAMVQLQFPENVELKALVDYVGDRMNLNFLYDQQILIGPRVTLKTPNRIPVRSLVPLLESILRSKGLMMVPSDVQGIIEIKKAAALTADATVPGLAPGPDGKVVAPVTRVFEIRHVDARQIETVVKPFLSSPNATLTPLPDQGIVIITELPGNMQRVEAMMAVIDRPRREVIVRFIKIENVDANAALKSVTQMLDGKQKARGQKPTAGGEVSLFADDRTNRLAVIGPTQAEVDEVVEIIRTFDQPLGLTREHYTFTTVSAARADDLIRQIIGESTTERLYKSVIDPDLNLLIATTTPEIHKQIADLKSKLDSEDIDQSKISPIRFYKLENAKAADVLFTIQAIEGDIGLGNVRIDGVSGKTDRESGVISGPKPEDLNRRSDSTRTPRPGAVKLQNVRVMADEPTNTIIVIAEPSIQAIYERLIRKLDVRRPQVLLTATIVVIDTTDDFSLGVEFGGHGQAGDVKILSFSSFGLSEVDPDTGTLALSPGTGFNGAVISGDIASMVVRALKTDRRVKVVSRPSVLVNDNAKAILISKTEEPYSSLNSNNTVASTGR
jgi:type II secretory pathway component GspD/PulD (secretin)